MPNHHQQHQQNPSGQQHHQKKKKKKKTKKKEQLNLKEEQESTLRHLQDMFKDVLDSVLIHAILEEHGYAGTIMFMNRIVSGRIVISVC